MEKKDILNTAEQKIAEMNSDGKDIFLVNLKLSDNNKISVYIDSKSGVKIDDCAQLSKAIEAEYDREKEDFEIQVSSAGLGQPFMVIQQYQKNIGNEIKVETNDKQRIRGILEALDKGVITITERKKKKSKSKKKEIRTITHTIDINEIKSAKEIINF